MTGVRVGILAAMLAAGGICTAAHQLLDRVVARVGGHVIFWTDVEAARGLGVIDVEPGPAADQEAVERMVDRQLMLMEVARFSPPEPAPASVDALVSAFRQNAGPELEPLMRRTGADERRIRAFARDTLRLQAYLDQRFGLAVQVTDDEVRQYFEANRQEFVREGSVVSFEQIEGLVRQRAAARRRNAVIGQWVRDLRARTEIVMRPPGER
jgi:hypothetical protein